MTTNTYIYIPGLTYTSKGPAHIDAIRLEAYIMADSEPTSLDVYNEAQSSNNLTKGPVAYKAFEASNTAAEYHNVSNNTTAIQYGKLSKLTYPKRSDYGRYFDMITSVDDGKYYHTISYGTNSSKCLELCSTNNNTDFHDGLFIVQLPDSNLNVDLTLKFTFYTRITEVNGELYAGEDDSNPDFTDDDDTLFSKGYIIIGELTKIYNPATSGVSELDFAVDPNAEYLPLYYDILSENLEFTFEIPVTAGFLVGNTDKNFGETTHDVGGYTFYWQWSYNNDTKKHFCNKALLCNSKQISQAEYVNNFYRGIRECKYNFLPTPNPIKLATSNCTLVHYEHRGRNWVVAYPNIQSDWKSSRLSVEGTYERLKFAPFYMTEYELTSNADIKYLYCPCLLDKLTYLYNKNPKIYIQNIESLNQNLIIGNFYVIVPIGKIENIYRIDHEYKNNYLAAGMATTELCKFSPWSFYNFFVNKYIYEYYPYDTWNAYYTYAQLDSLYPTLTQDVFETEYLCKYTGTLLEDNKLVASANIKSYKYTTNFRKGNFVAESQESNVYYNKTHQCDELNIKNRYNTSSYLYTLFTDFFNNKIDVNNIFNTSVSAIYGDRLEIFNYDSSEDYSQNKITDGLSILNPGNSVQKEISALNKALTITFNMSDVRVPLSSFFKESDICLKTYVGISSPFMIDLSKSDITYNNKGDYSICPIIFNKTNGYLEGNALSVNIDTSTNYLCNTKDSITDSKETLNCQKIWDISSNYKTTFCNEKRFVRAKDYSTISFSNITLEANCLYAMVINSDIGRTDYVCSVKSLTTSHNALSKDGLVLIYITKSDTYHIQCSNLSSLANYIGSIGLYKVTPADQNITNTFIQSVLEPLTDDLYVCGNSNSHVLSLVMDKIIFPSAFCAMEEVEIFTPEKYDSTLYDEYDWKYNSDYLTYCNISKLYWFKYLPPEAYYKVEAYYKLNNSYVQESDIELVTGSGFLNAGQVVTKIASIEIKKEQ